LHYHFPAFYHFHVSSVCFLLSALSYCGLAFIACCDRWGCVTFHELCSPSFYYQCWLCYEIWGSHGSQY
jgi:hypothetical protein